MGTIRLVLQNGRDALSALPSGGVALLEMLYGGSGGKPSVEADSCTMGFQSIVLS